MRITDSVLNDLRALRAARFPWFRGFQDLLNVAIGTGCMRDHTVSCCSQGHAEGFQLTLPLEPVHPLMGLQQPTSTSLRQACFGAREKHGFSLRPWAYHFFHSTAFSARLSGVNSATGCLSPRVILLELPLPLGFTDLQPAVLRLPAFGDRQPCDPQSW